MIDNVSDLIKDAEGLRLAAYPDTEGVLTVGWGHTGKDVVPGMTITTQDAQALFDTDLATARRGAVAAYGVAPWTVLDVVRQAVLIDMAFQLGEYGLADFHKMLAAIRGRVWQAAHDEALDSLWAKQTPSRAERNATILLSGDWPE